MCDYYNGQINLRTKKKCEVLSATTLKYLKMGVESSFEEGGVPFPYSQIHFELKWKKLLGSYLWVNRNNKSLCVLNPFDSARKKDC